MPLQDLDNTDLKQSPSPNRYNLKSSIGAGPKITMGSRTVIPSQSPKRYLNMPEPATYNISSITGKSLPMISLSGRHP